MEHQLQGKSVIITGSGQGLGRAYALDAAAAGASVVVNDIVASAASSVVEEIAASGGVAVSSTATVTEEAGAQQLIECAVAAFGRLDGIVNNAGVLYEGPAWDATPRQIQHMVEVNLLGTVYCGHAAIRQFLTQGGAGSVVNVTSGTHLGMPGLAVYGATKGAVASLTYGWALDLHATGVRVNAVSPLAVTSMKLPPYDGHAMPADIAGVVRYLLSDSSSNINGQLVRRARTQLGLIRHPAIGVMLDGNWDFAQIADAFDTTLADEQEPIGYGTHQVNMRPR